MFSLASLPNFARNARRFKEIAGILSKYGFAEFFSPSSPAFLQNHLRAPDGGRLTELARETRVRLALTELGPTFIKLGQILSTRADIVGPELALELAKLRADIEPDPFAAIRATIEAELGALPEALFAAFEETAIASASIGQVHRAVLPDGTRVVVKVQHAGIEDKVRADLDILMGLAELAERGIVELRLYQPLAVAQEMRRTILRELDFIREERNLQHFAANFATEPRVVFPRTFPRLSSRRVLTMEELSGISVAELAQRSQGPEEAEHRERLARAVAEIFLEMIFRDRFFHADPHPGNIRILPDDRIGLLDCGMVGRLDDRNHKLLENIILAMVEGDAESLAEQVMRMGRLPPGLDREGLRTDVEDFVSDYANQPIGSLNLSGALIDITSLVRRHGVLLPATVAHLVKVFIILDGVARSLNPAFSFMEVIAPYQRKIIARRFSPSQLWATLRRSYRDWSELFQAFPRDVEEILRRAKEGRLDVHLAHRGLDATVNRLVYGIISAALFLGSCQLMANRVPPLVFDISVFGALGCLAAILLGLRLLRSIRRSGELEARTEE